MKNSVACWLFNYMPSWEAVSKEVELLSRELGQFFHMNIISLNLLSRAPQIKLLGPHKYFPLPYSLLGVPFLRPFASRYRVNHIFSSPAERLLLPRLCELNSLITIAKDTTSLSLFERNIPSLKRFKYVVVESERDREMLAQAGVKEASIKLIYPGAELKPYHAPGAPFTILFATSPFGKNDLLSRGVYLITRVARRLPEVNFLFAWRDRWIRELDGVIRASGASNIHVENGYIPNMDRLYASVHATILPGLEYNSLKPCPHSALESLAHGKPVLISKPTSISALIERNRCGLVFEPSSDSLEAAIKYLITNYGDFQVNCHRAIQQNFSRQIFIEKYRALYSSMVDGV